MINKAISLSEIDRQKKRKKNLEKEKAGQFGRHFRKHDIRKNRYCPKDRERIAHSKNLIISVLLETASIMSNCPLVNTIIKINIAFVYTSFGLKHGAFFKTLSRSDLSKKIYTFNKFFKILFFSLTLKTENKNDNIATSIFCRLPNASS